MNPSSRLSPPPGVGALAGVLAAAVSLGVGELVAGFFRPAAAPLIAVGNRVIVLTPEPVKRWAIRQFGTGDKQALLTGCVLILAGAAAGLGVLAVRSAWAGLVGVAGLGGFGCYCALTAPAARTSDAVPALLGTAAGLGTLYWLLTLAARWTSDPGADSQARRQFLLAGLGTAVAAGAGTLLGRAVSHGRFNAAPARARITLPPAAGPDAGTVGFDLGKSGVPFQTPNRDFYRIDTALSVPQVDPQTWHLRIHGLVQREIRLSYADLLARPMIERWVTLTCVSNEIGGNLISTALFRGVLLADLLREAGIATAADQLLATSSDGMTIGSPTAVLLDGRAAMLAVGMNGEPLPLQHGFPVRMVVPGLYGYVSACKWLVDLEATTYERRQAYWVQGGWAAQGPVRLASRIDRPVQGNRVTVGAPVTVAGVAWDQHVGVSRVEVQFDGEPWQPATLARVPSIDTWRQWALPWTPTSAGRHRIRVRAYDHDGKPQDEQVRDPFPSGATGLHTIEVTATG